MYRKHFFRPSSLLFFFVTLIIISRLTACKSTDETPPSSDHTGVAPTIAPHFSSEIPITPTTEIAAETSPTAKENTDVVPAASNTDSAPTEESAAPAPSITADISFDAAADSIPVSPLLLGTNIPAWLGAERLADPLFRERAAAAETTIYRIPGGSWSNGYSWLACEREGAGIDENDQCEWGWAARPSTFIHFIQAVDGETMYTVNLNGTAKEAAAAVAFFNGAIDDDTVIGEDVRGRDWGKVSDWAQLRQDNGNPEPLNVRYWEVGNEIYGGQYGMGTNCDFEWGWEYVWTCDGREYVNGIGDGADRKEGFIEFRSEMQKVDAAIMVGAVGITPQGDWGDWGNHVIEEAGGTMDFYVIHEYAFSNPQAENISYADALAYPQTHWQDLTEDATDSFKKYANGRSIPIAITEHNLVAIQENDNDQWMRRAVNMLFMADSIGQMVQNGISVANQWDFANGRPDNDTDYGLIDADSYAYHPQYYIYPMWSQFGSEMLPVTSAYAADTTLSMYAGRVDEQTVTLLVINKTGEEIVSTIQIENISELSGGTAVVAQADSLDADTVTFNGIDNPSDIKDAPAIPLTDLQLPLSRAFPPYSVTLLQITSGGAE